MFVYTLHIQKKPTFLLQERHNIIWLARSNTIGEEFPEEKGNNGVFIKTGKIISPTKDGYTKIQSFLEEAYCVVSRGSVQQITLYDMEEEEVCTSGNFHFTHIILKNTDNQHILITGIIPPKNHTYCNFGVSGGYSYDRWYEPLDMLPEAYLNVWSTIYNGVFDRQYRYLATPHTFDTDTRKWNKIDISHIPECTSNIQ